MEQSIQTRDFLFELGCEELPASCLVAIATSLCDHFKQELERADISYACIELYYTPRRIALFVKSLAEKQSPREEERQGPSAKVAFGKDGLPTMAGLGFMKSCGVTLDDIEVRDTKKGQYVYCTRVLPGEETLSLLPGMIEIALKKCPIPKPMRWGNSDVKFIRPVHWVVMMFGDAVCREDILGKRAGHETYGHRFHSPERIRIQSPAMYLDQLKQAYVIADPAERKQSIRDALDAAASDAMHVVVDEELLDEVNVLVEWPVVLLGKFDQAFLSVPKEALMTSMKSHQKCFSVTNTAGELQPYFAIVSNIESSDPSSVIRGNERVMRARLSDAAFFYEQDIEENFTEKHKALSRVVFHKGLGTLADKTKRMEKLAAWLAKKLDADAAQVKQAAHLAKCDLLTHMVFEFPELQGVMGYYYAQKAGIEKPIAMALKEQYYPRFSGDQLPEGVLGRVLALADRIDTLVGVIGMHKKPTGDKDPFALRRAALGLIRLCIECELAFDLQKALTEAVKAFGELKYKDVVSMVWDFIIARLKVYYTEQGVTVQAYEAVAAVSTDSLYDFNQRIKAVQAFLKQPEALSLAAANKRVSNILKKQKVTTAKKPTLAAMDLDAEKQLYKALEEKAIEVDKLIKHRNYQAAFTALSTLRPVIDQFFDDVMVMDKDKKKKDNRLSLLFMLHSLFMQCADISQLSI